MKSFKNTFIGDIKKQMKQILYLNKINLFLCLFLQENTTLCCYNVTSKIKKPINQLINRFLSTQGGSTKTTNNHILKTPYFIKKNL
jgi:hypothetical protein